MVGVLSKSANADDEVLNAGRDLRNGRPPHAWTVTAQITVLNAGRDLRNGRLRYCGIHFCS